LKLEPMLFIAHYYLTSYLPHNTISQAKMIVLVEEIMHIKYTI